jgi:diaminohydroxyphosphoribosylaminopyrimidine deaminase/5-amino-6-(5-phosphoribosylamino)uracil reductase
VGVVQQPRRLAFGLGPLPEGSELELRSRDPSVELAELGADGVQSLLLEGGPTLATAFLERDLIDKLVLFVAPKLSGEGPRYLHDFGRAVTLRRVSVTAIGDDLMIEAYIHEP